MSSPPSPRFVWKTGLNSVYFVPPPPPRVKEEHRRAFFGEDVHIVVPPGEAGEVVFRPGSDESAQEFVMKAGRVVSSQAYLNSLGHLVLEDVQERNQGVYVVRNANTSQVMKRLILTVRDCILEQVVKYGETFYIHLGNIEGPITVAVEPSTKPPPMVLYNRTVVDDDYVKRLSVSDHRVALHSVRMGDEGSFTVLDREGKIRMRDCLNVRGKHQMFLRLSYGQNLRMKLHLHHSLLNVVYRPRSDHHDRPVLQRGVLVAPLDPQLEGRLTVEGSQLSMKRLQQADSGLFRITDLEGFLVAEVHVQVEAYKLPALTVSILALLGLVAFMLLVCLLSCLYKVHQRKEKNKKLMLLAQQAGKGDGEAFRQVVHEAYTRFTEESLMQSVCDQPSESTEVTIKGLEVSKPGRYQALTSENFLEMSDSGVEFNSSAHPLDSDTDAAMTFASHKPLLNAVSPTAVTAGGHSDSLEATVVPDGELSATRTPDSVLSASPASNPRSLAPATPDGAASPGMASRGTVESDSAKTDGGADGGEGGQEEESAQST
uniref:Uncharacterized protein n=1 Tax=Salarias fasciatus TaxID=181472 RepID=A0A672I3L8_SALFA